MSAPNERSRPSLATGTAKELLNEDTPSVRATSDFLAILAECSEPDDPAFRAASLIADAWGPALDRSYRLGYETGYAAGFWEAERDMAKAWAKAAQPVRDVLAQPTRDELAALRGESA